MYRKDGGARSPDDGQGNSGPCSSGHSSEFCRGWDDATNGSAGSSTSSGSSSFIQIHVPTYQYMSVLHCSSVGCYNAGFLDGKWDSQHGIGADFSCPRNPDVSHNYCSGYHDGYDNIGGPSSGSILVKAVNACLNHLGVCASLAKLAIGALS